MNVQERLKQPQGGCCVRRTSVRTGQPRASDVSPTERGAKLRSTARLGNRATTADQSDIQRANLGRCDEISTPSSRVALDLFGTREFEITGVPRVPGYRYVLIRAPKQEFSYGSR